MDTNMTLDDYRRLVEQMMQEVLLSDSNTPRSFTNSGTQHAKIVLDVLLDNTQSSLDIISHKMSKQVWDSNKIRAVLDRSPSIVVRVLVCDGNSLTDDESALSDMHDLVESGKLKIRTAQVPAGLNVNHVAVADKQHARVETDQAARKALVSFGNEKLARSALMVFEPLWTRSA